MEKNKISSTIELSAVIPLLNDGEIVYEKRVTPFGNSGKVDVPKKYIGKRAYVIILKE